MGFRPPLDGPFLLPALPLWPSVDPPVSRCQNLGMRRLVPLLSAILLLATTAALADQDLKPLEAQVETLRGLKFKRDVPARFVDTAALQVVVRREMAASYPDDTWHAMERTLKVFGLIPPKMNLRAVLAGMMEEQVAGLYDPDEKALYVNRQPLEGSEMLSELGLGDLNMTDVYLIHELDHAVTDQAFHLKRLPLDDLENEDRASAARCVVEGDATWVMLRYLYQVLKVPENQQDKMGDMMATMNMGKELLGGGTPAYLQENLLVGYLGGVALVKQAYSRGGFPAVNGLYERPPQSMEQVLHPAKYFAGDDPPVKVAVTLPKAWAAAGWKDFYHGVWGEMNVRIILQEWGVPEDAARKASEGWGGDFFRAVEGPGGSAGFVWATVWDTDRDASEFEAAARTAKDVSVVREGVRVTVTKGGVAPAAPKAGPAAKARP